jgi:hypothetical protein
MDRFRRKKKSDGWDDDSGDVRWGVRGLFLICNSVGNYKTFTLPKN